MQEGKGWISAGIIMGTASTCHLTGLNVPSGEPAAGDKKMGVPLHGRDANLKAII